MNSWHYQLIKLKSDNPAETGMYRLAEVYLNAKGQPFAYSFEDTFYVEENDIIEELESKLEDVYTYPVLDQDELDLNIKNIKPEDDPFYEAMEHLKKIKEENDPLD